MTPNDRDVASDPGQLLRWAHWAAVDAAGDAVRRAAIADERLVDAASVDVGETPSEVVYEENKLQLRRYEALTESQHDIPILIVYALINRPFILDLQSDRSVVRRLLEAGHDVYLIDWGEPSRLDASLSLEDYVTRYIENCVDVVRERAGRQSINLFGYCMGGTMAAIYAALRPAKVNALALMAPALYFEGTGGVLELWGDEAHFDPRPLADALGNLPGEFLAVGFAGMDPVANYLTKYVHLLDRLENEDFVENFARMETWLGDGVDLGGEVYAEFLEDIYQDNRLCRNELTVGGEQVDLDNVDMPVLQVLGTYDNLVPPEASTPFNDAVGSDAVTIIEYPTGHVGLAMSNATHRDVWPEVAAWFHEQVERPPLADVIANGIEAELGLDVETDVTEGGAREVEIALSDGEREIAREVVPLDAESIEAFFEDVLSVEIAVDTGELGIAVTVVTDEGPRTTIIDNIGAAISDEVLESLEKIDDATTYDLVDVEGIGPTYAGRLHEAGITSADELAVSSERLVADAADATTSLARAWIERARELVGATEPVEREF